MDVLQRRALLELDPNPDAKLDYLVSLDGTAALPGFSESARMSLSYVPDRHIVKPAAFHRYIEVLSEEPFSSLESFAVTFLNDVNNELVPRWIRVSLINSHNSASGTENHGVTLEDRQPKWENASLLSMT